MWRSAAVRGKMAVPGAQLAAASPGEEIQLATDGSTESVAVPLRATRTKSPSKALDRRREKGWIRAAQGGSDEALEQLHRHHWPWAPRAAYLVVHDAAAAEDIAQEAFLAAIRNLDRFDRRRPFAPWLHRIVVNRAIDHARARTLRAETDLQPSFAAPAAAPDAPEKATLAAIGRLPLDQRAVVVLRYLLEYTPGEIATMLNVPRGTVNSRLRRGLD